MSDLAPDSDSDSDPSGQPSPSASAGVPVESLLAAVSALLSAELHSSSSQHTLLKDCNNIAAGKVSRATLHTTALRRRTSARCTPHRSTLTHSLGQLQQPQAHTHGPKPLTRAALSLAA